MMRPWCVLILMSPLLALARADGPTDDELKKKPITTDNGEVGKLLKGWYAEGSAAGNVGDWYDNRDRDHSALDMNRYPQLRKVVYSAEDMKLRRDWALATTVRPEVTFGNSSTSAPPEMGGSNPRHAYCSVRELAKLHKQYVGNNLYIYPEHRDHDPGHDGLGDGYGDLYPTNTPYLITSQGSSGSDQPFMRAIPFTLAAFRPEVKKKLSESGLLMPTIQMVFRASNRHLKDPKEYLTGKAHPSVFEGSWVDDLKMVRMAHDISAETVPPLVALEVIEEDEALPGRDFFEPAGFTEKLGDTPGVIARVWRGQAHKRRLLISAEDSRDLNKKPLTFTWVVLRGDPKRITITPKNKAGSLAEVVVAYHERMPVAPGSPMESNRVDIGVFAHNGHYRSAPAFVTFFSLDREARTYDEKGRIVEIGYGAGVLARSVSDHAALMEALAKGPAARLIKLTPGQREALIKVAAELRPLAQAQKAAREKKQAAQKGRDRAAAQLKDAEADLAAVRKATPGGEEEKEAQEALARRKKELLTADEALKSADKALADATARVGAFLDGKREGLDPSPRLFVENALKTACRDPELWNGKLSTFSTLYSDAPAARKKALEAARKKLADLGIVEKSEMHRLTFRPARKGDSSPERRLTGFEQTWLEYFQAVALAELAFPGLLQVSYRPNFVDQRLTTPKAWRDVYRHDSEGKLAGWTRFSDGEAAEFLADGYLVVARDPKGRPIKARSMVYRQEPLPPGRFGLNGNPLKAVKGDELVTYEYDEDGKRSEVKREKLFVER